jgi:hypothetical protein
VFFAALAEADALGELAESHGESLSAVIHHILSSTLGEEK